MDITKSQIKKQEILIQGMEVMWSKGYNGTSVNDIVQAANVPKGSFYFYFNSKEDFTVQALQAYAAQNKERLFSILSDTTLSPLERLLKHYKQRVSTMQKDLACSKGCFAANLTTEMAENNEPIRLAIMQIMNAQKAPLTKLVKQAQAAKEISNELRAESIIAFIEDAWRGSLVTMKAEQSDTSLKNFLQLTEQLILT